MRNYITVIKDIPFDFAATALKEWINKSTDDITVLEYYWRRETCIGRRCLFINFKSNNAKNAIAACQMKINWLSYQFQLYDTWEEDDMIK